MNQEQLTTLLNVIKSTPDNSESDKLIANVLKLAADSITLDTLKELTSSGQRLPQVQSPANKKPPVKGNKENDSDETFGILHFSKKELSTMPKKFQQSFIMDNKIVKFRYHQGLFHARYRRDGYNIEVASKDFDTMKRKFMLRLCGQYETPNRQPKAPKIPFFGDYGESWLETKKATTKGSTHAEYARMFERDLKPRFGTLKLSEINRPMLQSFLFEYTGAGKHRTAQKLKLILNCIFDLATEDFSIKSPVKKIVLPYYESKKGSAFTKEEEKKLVDYCIANPDGATTSAMLVLLYFGLRQCELKTLQIIDGKFLDCITGKERLGRNETHRQIPITPVARRVLPHIDFEKAKNTNPDSIRTLFTRLFPNHHPHELRYTFITRCKECGVNHELVMLWDGHKDDKEVKTSKVDRGYTDYSKEYILAEAEKVNYEF